MDDDRRPGVIQDENFQPAGTGYRPHRKSNKRWLIPLVLITLFVGAPLFAGINFWVNIEDFNFEFRDSYSHNAQMGTEDEILAIDIANVLGDIEIDNNLLDANSLFEISTDALSNDKGIENFLDYQWDIQKIGNTYLLSFVVESSFYNDDIKFNHHVRIHKNITLSTLDLVTTTGSVSVVLDEVKIWDSLLESVTGSITFNLINSEVSGEIIIEAVTGDVDFKMEDNDFQSDVDVSLQLVTGSIDLFWKQKNLEKRVTISLETTTGSIQGELHLNETISTSYTHDLVSGNVNLPNSNTGTTGTMTLDASLVTGDIDIEYFQLS